MAKKDEKENDVNKAMLDRFRNTEPYGPGDVIMQRDIGSVFIGQIVKQTATMRYLAPACWVRSVGDGQHMRALQSGELQHVEPIPDECLPLEIARAPELDCCRWPHAVPSKQK